TEKINSQLLRKSLRSSGFPEKGLCSGRRRSLVEEVSLSFFLIASLTAALRRIWNSSGPIPTIVFVTWGWGLGRSWGIGMGVPGAFAIPKDWGWPILLCLSIMSS